MSNPYILNSKLSAEEVQRLVWELVWFHSYRKIFENRERSPQALRPVLVQIERRMYFECDDWIIFHLLELSHLNLNQKLTPYINEMNFVIEAICQLPRNAKKSRMTFKGETMVFEDEIDCLFSCPQHLPPVDFVKRYGLAQPIQNFTKREHEDECKARINLKRSCSACKSLLRDIFCTPKKPFLFCFAMEYAAEFGRPRAQFYDTFIGRLAYALVWKTFELNARHYLLGVRGEIFAKARELSPEKRKPYLDNAMKENDNFVREKHRLAKEIALNYVLQNLMKDPIRVDRRGTHSAQ